MCSKWEGATWKVKGPFANQLSHCPVGRYLQSIKVNVKQAMAIRQYNETAHVSSRLIGIDNEGDHLLSVAVKLILLPRTLFSLIRLQEKKSNGICQELSPQQEEQNRHF